MDSEDEGLVGTRQRRTSSTGRALAILIVSVLLVSFCLLVCLMVMVVDLRDDVDDLRKEEGSRGEDAQLASIRAAVARTVEGDLDKSVDPCTDFYRYACGGWLDRAVIPPDRVTWGRGFASIDKRNEEALRAILEENYPMIGAFYKSCLDTDTIDKRGIDPVQKHYTVTLNEYGTTVSELSSLVGKLHRLGVSALLSMGIEIDAKNPERYAVVVGQGGLSLPDRSYYSDTTPKGQEILHKFKQHMASMFRLMGEAEARAEDMATRTLHVETHLAALHHERADLRDPNKTYNSFAYDSFTTKFAKGFGWDEYFKEVNTSFTHGSEFHPPAHVIVTVPDTIEETGKLLDDWNGVSDDRQSLKAYLKWKVIHGFHSVLPTSFVNESFAFFGKYLNGAKEITPRWRKCVGIVDDSLPEILGRYFVERHFPGDSAETSKEMIQRIENSFSSRLNALDWMDTTTRSKAKEKLHLIVNMVAFPKTWEDYSKVENLELDTFFENAERIQRFAWNKLISKYPKEVDKDEWLMSPPTVNAYYEAERNQMVFPAGILQPPFFNISYPMAMNFGGIGVVMGHELTHAFDDQGRKFDGTGRLHEWFGAESIAHFNTKAACVRTQYESVPVINDLHVNGNLTLGENIADIGGVRDAFAAYQSFVHEHGEELPLLSEFTNDQLFFIAFAQTWCNKITDEYQIVRLKTDPHSPAKLRVNLPLKNFDVFAQTFQCSGDPSWVIHSAVLYGENDHLV